MDTPVMVAALFATVMLILGGLLLVERRTRHVGVLPTAVGIVVWLVLLLAVPFGN